MVATGDDCEPHQQFLHNVMCVCVCLSQSLLFVVTEH